MRYKFLLTALFVLSLKNGFGQVYYEYQKLQSSITNDCTSYGLLNYPGDLHSSDTRMIVPMSYFQCDTAVNVVALYEKVDNLWMPDTVIYLLDTTIWLSIRAIISDEFACVSDQLDDTLAVASGSITIFQNQEGVWNQVQKIYPSDPGNTNQFGQRMSLSGNFLFVSMQLNDETADAYEVFEWTGSQWVFLEQYPDFHPVNAEINDELVVFMGSPETGNLDPYALYTFSHSNGELFPLDTLPASVPYLHYALDKLSNTLVVQELQTGSDVLNFYDWQNNQWVWQESLLQQSTIGFATLAFEGNFLALSYPSADIQGMNSGLVELYVKGENGWQYHGQLLTSDLSYEDSIGRLLGRSGTDLLITSDDITGSYATGAVYVFRLSGCTDPMACNYLPDGIVENASCVFPGCADPAACNYDATACAGGSCVYGENGDFGCSGTIDINDLLMLIGAYGCIGDCGVFDLDGDGIVGIFDIILLLTWLE